MDEEELEKHTTVVETVEPIERPPPQYDYAPFISEEKMERKIKRNTKKSEFLIGQEKPLATSSRRSSIGSNSSLQNMSKLELMKALKEEDSEV